MGVPMGGTIIVPWPGRIPWTAVRHWCRANGYGPDASEFLDTCLLAMDGVFLRWWGETNTPKK